MGSKGPSQSGNITQTTTNPTQQQQLPFLKEGWTGAENLFQNNPLKYYPGQTLADFNPYIAGGYNHLATEAAPVANTLAGIGSGLFNSGANGAYGVTNSPAFNGLAGIASGNNPFSGSVDSVRSLLGNIGYLDQGLGGNTAGLAAAGSGFNPAALQAYGSAAASGGPDASALESLANGANGYLSGIMPTLQGESTGAFLNKNPYIDAVYQAAANPVTRNYQTATAPNTDAAFEAAGRYGSGSLQGARGQNEQNLGKTLGDLSANIYGTNYANERNLMQQAQQTEGGFGLQDAALRGQQYGAAGNLRQAGLQTGIGAENAAGGLQQAETALKGNLYGQAGNLYGGAGTAYGNAGNLGLGQLGASGNALGAIQTGFNSGNALGLQNLSMLPNIINSQFAGGQQQTAAGQGLTSLNQAQIQDAMNRFYGEQNAPYQTLSAFLGNIGQPTTGSSTVQTPILGPNPITSGLGTLGSIKSLFGGGGGGGGLFGGGAGGFGQSAIGMDPGLTSILTGDPSLDGILTSAIPIGADAGGGGLGALSLGLTVICTELHRQGRMPKRWYYAAARADMAIPQIVRDGYHVWAIPSVRHMRRKPNSLYSRVLEKTFNWRAEDLAARAGVKGARKLWRGRMVTAALALPCLALGLALIPYLGRPKSPIRAPEIHLGQPEIYLGRPKSREAA